MAFTMELLARVVATSGILVSFAVLSLFSSYRQDDYKLFGNHRHDNFPDKDVPGNYFERLCPNNVTGHAYMNWVDYKDGCSLNCNPKHSFQGHPGKIACLYRVLPC